MSISTKEFRERLKRNRDRCFCGERLKAGRDGRYYCPHCDVFEPGTEVGGVIYSNGCREVVRA